MSKSNKPVIWLPFAAGGTVAAFVLPSLMLLVLLSVLGASPGALAFERVAALVAHPVGKLALLVAIGLPLWHAAHRLRMTLQDLGVRDPSGRAFVARMCYAAAALVTMVLLYVLLPS